MKTSARVIADSTYMGHRLTTIEMTYPLIIHAELMTYRMLSRCVASNRAIPTKRMLEAVTDDPFFPEVWPKNGAGMKPGDYLGEDEAFHAQDTWGLANRDMINYVKELQSIGVHKQITNRLLAPWLWTTAVVSSTEWDNLLGQRLRLDEGGMPLAQQEMYDLAQAIYKALQDSEPKTLRLGQWHLPYYTLDDYVPIQILDVGQLEYGDDALKYEGPFTLMLASAGRCARVSYLRQDEYFSTEDDWGLGHDKLVKLGHWSPLENVATPCEHVGHLYDYNTSTFRMRPSLVMKCKLTGNFNGFHQFRKFFKGENIDKYVPQDVGQKG